MFEEGDGQTQLSPACRWLSLMSSKKKGALTNSLVSQGGHIKASAYEWTQEKKNSRKKRGRSNTDR